MATNSINSSPITQKQGSPRRLFELLEEKQEPFVLEIYLLERGCRKKRLEFDVNDIGCFSTKQNDKNSSSKYLKKSSTNQSSNSGRKRSLQFSSVAKSIYSKIVLVNEVLKPKHGSKKKKGRWKDKEAMEPGRCSAASCSTLLKTSSESDTDRESVSSPANNETTHNKLGPHRVMGQWRFGEENKQFSPDSVLDEIDLLQAIPVYNVRQNQEEPPTASRIRLQKKVSEDSILSASLWEMLEQARKENPKKLESKSFPKYMNSMKAVLQTRQLLFDCVRDVVETQNNSKKQRIIMREKGLMGPEEIGKIMCNNLKTWGKLSANERSTKNLLKMDVLSSDKEEWGRFEEWKREIAKEIGNYVFEEITDEIVRDMVNQC